MLDGVSFEVAEGELCVLLGPSGCGKTTLLRIIALLEGQGGGDVILGDESITGLTPRQRDVAMVFQTYALYPHMSVFDTPRLSAAGPQGARRPDRRRVEDTARLLGIAEKLDGKPRELSGGQRQRVAIGRALVRSPRLFLFQTDGDRLPRRRSLTITSELPHPGRARARPGDLVRVGDEDTTGINISTVLTYCEYEETHTI